MGFRTYGKSKDSRDDLPQVVIGMAVTRAGIPVRVWSWPGNTTDSALIRQARADMRDWTLSRVMWVADRGFSSRENRRELRRGGGHYIIGEKLRSGSAEATAALSRPGRYQHVRDNLQVKEVRIADDERSSTLSQNIGTWADKAYQGAGGTVRTPYKRHRARPRLSPGQKAVNRAHARIRCPVEQAVAELKRRHVLDRLRCCPTTRTPSSPRSPS